MFEKIKRIGIKDFILGITQVVTILIAVLAILLYQGLDTIYVRSMISLFPIFIGSIAAFIAYKNYISGQSEKRRSYYIQYKINAIDKVEYEVMLNNAFAKVKLSADNFVFQTLNIYPQIAFWNKLAFHSHEELFKPNSSLLKHPNFTEDSETYYKSLIKFFELLRSRTSLDIKLIKKIIGDNRLNHKDKEELLEIILEKNFNGVFNQNILSIRDVLIKKVTAQKQFESVKINELISTYLPSLERIKISLGEYKYLMPTETSYRYN